MTVIKRKVRRSGRPHPSSDVQLPAFVPPCLARLTDAPPEGDQWVHEIKFDGYRLQIAVAGDNVRIYTRSGLDWTSRFPRLAEAAHKLAVRSALIDGEAVVFDAKGASNFTALVDALSNAQDSGIVLMAFDLLELNGEDLRRLPLAKRKEQLAGVLTGRGKQNVLRLSEHIRGDGKRMLIEVGRLGLEGIVSKRIDKPYASGRGGDWLKVKCINTDEFLVAGYVDSTALKNAIGSLVLATFKNDKLNYAGRVGTGFTTSLARSLWAKLQPLRRDTKPFAETLTQLQTRGVRWVQPKLVAQVGYRAITGDGILRHASFEGLREDKPTRQVQQPKTRG